MDRKIGRKKERKPTVTLWTVVVKNATVELSKMTVAQKLHDNYPYDCFHVYQVTAC